MAYRMVIADDEAIIRMDLREMLEEYGHEVVGMADNGETAWQLVRQEKPDVVLLDIKMPTLDGIQAARRIGHEHLAPVLLLTAYSQQEMVAKAKSSGVFGYVVKPVSPQRLFPAIEIAVAQFSRQEESYRQMAAMRERIETRKQVERAKDVMAAQFHLPEAEAYRRLQQYSMKHGIALREVAAAVIKQAGEKKK